MEFSFDEDTFIRRNEPERMAKRRTFVRYVRKIVDFYLPRYSPLWFTYVENIPHQVRRFSLSLSRPEDYPEDVNRFIHFAVALGVKHLELEFYDPRREQDRVFDPDQGFPLPDEVYEHLENLQTLKLIWCNFNFSRLTSFKNLETLTLGWIAITTSQLGDLVGSCPILNTLRLECCVVLDVLHIFSPNNTRPKNLEVEKCNLGRDLFLLDGPKLRRFIYSGKVARFRMGNTCELVEAGLHFAEQSEFVTGPLLCELLDQLVDVMSMTVSSVFLQIVPSGDGHYSTDSDLNVQHLTLYTELHVNEFIGIKFMLASCQRMNTLTLHIRPGKIFANYKAPYQMEQPLNFWDELVVTAEETCLRESLQVLNVHGFAGIHYQIPFIEYIIRFGRCLRSVNLYLPQMEHNGYNDQFMKFVVGGASKLKLAPRANPGLEITIRSPSYLAGTTQVRRFSLSLSKPHGYDLDVDEFIRFAVYHGVKHLELEFYDPRREQGRVIDPDDGYPLPEQVYDHHQNLHSLKLIWCNFDPSSLSRLTSFKNLETLDLAWMTITTSQLRDLVGSCPILNLLRLAFCSGFEALHISVPDNNSRPKSLEVDKCKLGTDLFLLDGPKLRKFVYSGKVARFHMGNTCELVEVGLDFGEQSEFLTGPLLCELLEQLVDVMFLTVCSVFLQIVPSGDAHYCTNFDLNVQHLTLNTGLHVYEFIGIKFMLASCPRMKTLTLCIQPGKIFHNYEPPFEITIPSSSWLESVTSETCVRESLRVLNVRGFEGTQRQMKFIENIMVYGRCLRSVNLYIPQMEHKEYNDNSMTFVLGRARDLKQTPAANKRLKITIQNPPYFANPID